MKMNDKHNQNIVIYKPKLEIIIVIQTTRKSCCSDIFVVKFNTLVENYQSLAITQNAQIVPIFSNPVKIKRDKLQTF